MELLIFIIILIMLIVLAVIAYINYTVINMAPLTDKEFEEYFEDVLAMLPPSLTDSETHRYRALGLQVYCNEPLELEKTEWNKEILGVKLNSMKALKLEGSSIDSLCVFETDEDRYFVFVGTKLLPTFLKEAISHSIVECPINDLRAVDIFSSTYEKYFPKIRDFVLDFDDDKNNHISGHSLGAVISHFFFHDFNSIFKFKSHYTIGCPRAFSSLTPILNSIALNIIMSGDSIPIFYDQIINGEGTVFPGDALYLNYNSSSWAINHHPVYYLYCTLKFYTSGDHFD